MELIIDIIFLTGLVLTTAYDDLSQNKVATQSTTAAGPTDAYRAGNAVDRDIKTCMRTDGMGLTNPDSSEWWKVDLGGVYNIYSVNILYKNYAGLEMRQRGRFAGFSLYVSNTGVMDNSSTCYKDGPHLPPLNFTTTCMTSGRYVTFYNERDSGVKYPAGYELHTVFTELCEVIVQGCKTSGVYGEHCELRCPTNCRDNTCHIHKGTCFGCSPGWKGTTCNTECVGGQYGVDCNQQCSGNCRDNAVCNHVTGHCEEGCSAGWKGVLCDKECENRTYGNNCVHKCSGNCMNESPCNTQTGHCEGGCKPGYINALCNEHCLSGHYGYRCEKACSGNCLYNSICDYIDGKCIDGCQPGYIGKLCNAFCKNGYYGQNCSRVCSSNCKTCKPTDGTCSCSAGWMGPDCSIACNKSYGENCQNPCSPYCINQTCDPFNGTCLTSCKDKSYGDKCIAEIRGKYISSESTTSSSVPAAIGGTLAICVLLIVSAALMLIRRKKSCMPRTTGSHYAEVEIRQSENSTYQQLSVSGLGSDNTNQQQNISELDTVYQQLNVSELLPENTYQQLNASALRSNNNNPQQNVSGLRFDNAYQNLSLQ